MSDIVLNAYRVEEMNFKNVLGAGVKIKLENKYTFSIKYETGNKCVGTLSIEVFDGENPDKFFAKTVVSAFFTYNPETEKDALHRAAFKDVFPYAKSIITTLTANGGVPPIVLPAVDIDSQNVYRFDFGKK